MTGPAGMAAGDEAQSVDIFEELCEVYRRHGASQDESSGLVRFQNAHQQVGDLAELMRSYGFPTPGWSSEEDAEGPSGAADMAVDQVPLPICFPNQALWLQHESLLGKTSNLQVLSVICVSIGLNGVGCPASDFWHPATSTRIIVLCFVYTTACICLVVIASHWHESRDPYTAH